MHTYIQINKYLNKAFPPVSPSIFRDVDLNLSPNTSCLV